MFDGNHYAGRRIDRPDDPKGHVEAAAGTPNFDWHPPEFDPAHPDGFDVFLVQHRAWMVYG